MSSDQRPVERHRTRSLRARLLVAALVALLANPASAADADDRAVAGAAAAENGARTAFLPFLKPHRPPLYESQPHNVTPHPAVARIIVPEQGATAFGSGTLVDVRDQFGLVVTNWHVVRDSRGVVNVTFPCGFRSQARPLKVDSNWDLAALVIWRPPIEPVKLAKQPPRPGDLLTIHGYGRGQYRIATGRCTTYYAPKINFPHEMVELDVEARQGDSGGPIFNERGELAGVLFGAGQGTTLGSYAPRVSNFLATLAPDIGQAKDQARIAVADRPAPNVTPVAEERQVAAAKEYPSSPWSPPVTVVSNQAAAPRVENPPASDAATPLVEADAIATTDEPTGDWFDTLKSGLAVLGLVAIALHLIKAIK